TSKFLAEGNTGDDYMDDDDESSTVFDGSMDVSLETPSAVEHGLHPNKRRRPLQDEDDAAITTSNQRDKIVNFQYLENQIAQWKESKVALALAQDR
ncbi:hypothetical protein H0H93_003431, partial [Arthromyces matolae]